MLLNLGLADSKILYFWQVLEYIHQFIIELQVMQCLFLRRSNKTQRRGRIISNFTKMETFHLLHQPSGLGDNLAMWSLFLNPSIKGFSFPFSLDKKRIYLENQLKEEFTDLFWKFPGYKYKQSTNRMINTFIIVNITPICR